MFESLPKLQIYLATGGVVEGNDGRTAVLLLIEEIEAMRGHVEALKLLLERLALHLKSAATTT